jgi:hypothetical protein
MNEFDFVLLMTYMFGGFAVICIALMIIETLALKLFPHKYWREDELSKELDLLYLELQKGKEINIAEYIKEKK